MIDFNVKLINNLNISTVKFERDRLLSRIKNNQAQMVVIDLSLVENCDTSGIVFLIDIKKQCIKYSKKLQFTKVPQKIIDLATFYEVDEILVNPS